MVVKVKHSYDIAALAKHRGLWVLTNRSLSCSKYCCTCPYVSCASILFSKCKKKGFVVEVVAEAFNVFIRGKWKFYIVSVLHDNMHSIFLGVNAYHILNQAPKLRVWTSEILKLLCSFMRGTSGLSARFTRNIGTLYLAPFFWVFGFSPLE